MIEKISELSCFKKILKEFPRNMKYCFAYGSGAFQQKNNCGNNMLDLIFVVNNTNRWHMENLKRNPKHYAQPLRLLGDKVISNVQDGWGAKVYYNTLIKTSEGHEIKYGVISEAALLEDLLDWNDLYLAGRLHKPVKVLVNFDENSLLHTALNQNLHSAVHAALLLLPEHFTEIVFYKTIAGLSYGGDFRMTFGENKDKVNNIVVPQIEHFRKLYSPILLDHFNNYLDIPLTEQNVTCHQDTSPGAKIHHLNQLPRTPQVRLVKAWSHGSRLKDTEDSLRAIAYDPECSELLEQCLKNIVWRSSVTQSLKGILTAGLFKSVRYSGAKVMKMLKSYKPEAIMKKTDKIEIKSINGNVKKDVDTKDTYKEPQ